MCRVFNVSRSGYHGWRRAQAAPCPRRQRRQQLDEQVARLFDQEKQRSGARRLCRLLQHQGYHVNRKTVACSLRRQGLKAKATQRFKATTQSRHSLPVAPNYLQQRFDVESRDTAWVSDITYVRTREGWLYLAVVLDLYSRRVIGWAMDETMKQQLVINAHTMATRRRGHPVGVIVHSDRGSQYCSTAYRRGLSEAGHLCSMSKKGDCYDNAVAESFFHSLKVELINDGNYQSREQAKQSIFRYIESYYNRTRLHSTLNYQSPEQFEAA